MRKYTLYILALLFAISSKSVAKVPTGAEDSVRTQDIDEIVVVSSSKENTKLRRRPVAVSLLGAQDLADRRVMSIKGASALVPNFYMPDYGSRLTSAVYIRGIGSRMNTPAVGLYVDGAPCIDKSAYDFRFLDVERLDVLRGPQATLYGRNAMGGLVHIHTADPVRNSGTDVKLGGYSHGLGANAAFTTILKPSDKFALSLGGYGEVKRGFFKNHTTGDYADDARDYGAKTRMVFLPNGNLRIDLSASYTYSDEGACPYYYEGTTADFEAYPEAVGIISSNRPSSYRRNLFNSGLNISRTDGNFTLTSTTGYQYLNDCLFMDQDFIAADIFSLTQKQKMNTVSEELTLKSKPGRRWQWIAGAFFMYQGLETQCPIDFYTDGVNFLNGQFAGMFGAIPMIHEATFILTDAGLPFRSEMSTPVANAALFHQSTINDLFADGLSLTIGLRVDYDYRRLRLHSWMANPVNYDFSMSVQMNPAMPPIVVNRQESVSPQQHGRTTDHNFEFLPKVALQYELPGGRGNVYATVAKGYRSGGYNIQQYGDLAQMLLRREIMTKLGAPANVVPAEPQIAALEYRPEESWNYELGGHFDLCNRHVRADMAVFYTTTKNQQIARFAQSGMGREMVNAGKSSSLGAEVSLRAFALKERLTFSVNYGFTHAVFTEYDLGESAGQKVDYSDNRVPFVPRHTLGASVDFRQPLDGRVLRGVSVGADVQGAGKIYWDEAFSFCLDFHAVLGAHVRLEILDKLKLTVWGKNLTASRYDTFSFDSMNRRYSQRGVPFHAGFDVCLHF